jgi:hypothetical protein
MSTDHPPLDAARTEAAAAAARDFDQRWAAWQAAGAARDRVVARRMAVLAPVLISGAILAVWLLGR